MRRRFDARGGLALGALAHALQVQTLNLPRESLRVVDRAGGAFGNDGRVRLKPIGRPSDIYGDALVSVVSIRFGRAA